MATYNPASAAGMIFPIIGAGIGIGVLAHTAKNVTRMTDSMYDTKPRRRRAPRRSSSLVYKPRTRQRRRY